MGKIIIDRRSFQRQIPKLVQNRRNTKGFSQPTALGLTHDLRKDAHERLLDSRSLQRGIWNKYDVSNLLSQHAGNNINHDRLLWGLMTLELWMREYIDRT